jgi:hypothetical protein
MKNIAITIEPVSPLLMHRFNDNTEIGVQNGHRPVASGDRGTPRQQAEGFAYKDDNGNLFIPGPALFSAIVSAGKFHKHGKNKLTTFATSLVPAGLIVTDLAVPLGTKAFEVDSRRVVNRSTGGAHICHRPRIDKYKATFNVQWDDAYFPANLVRLLVDDAGSKIGIGAFRPEKKGPFGRFTVTKWVVS